MNSQTLRGDWTQLKGRIRQQWGDITGDELDGFEGNVEQLVGMIQEKTGDAREAIERQIRNFAEAGSNGTAHLRQRAQEQVEYAATTAQQAAEQAADAIRSKYQEAEQVVKRKPMESLAMTFAIGLVCGIGATLVLKSK